MEVTTPVELQQGIIYKIQSPHCEQVYIGSTKNRLCLRKAIHLYHFREHQNPGKFIPPFSTAYKVLEKGDCEFIEVERIMFSNIKELRKREKEIQHEYREMGKLINVNEAYMSKDEKDAKNRERAKKQYREHQMELKANSLNQYYLNREKRLATSKQYYKDHRSEMLARAKQLRDHGKKCECGIVYLTSKERHLMGLPHEKRMAKLNKQYGTANDHVKPTSEDGIEEEATSSKST